MCCGITFINSELRNARKGCEGRYFYKEDFQLNLPLERFLSSEEKQDNLLKGRKCYHLTSSVGKPAFKVL